MSPYFGYLRTLNTTNWHMLPVHRSSPSEVSPSSHLLSKWPLSKSMVRWSTLACVVITIIWIGDLLSLGRSEHWLRPWDSLRTTTATTSHIQRPSIVPLPTTKEEQDVWEPRKNEVRSALKHAWSGYKSIAYPNDELLPVSGGRSNKSFSPLSYLKFDPLTLFYAIFLKGIMAGV